MTVNIAKIYENQNVTDSAIFYYSRALDMSKKNDYDDMAIEIGRHLTRQLDKAGYKDKALITRYETLCLADSLSSLSEYAQIMDMSLKCVDNHFRFVIII